MYPPVIKKIIALFSKFPTVGPRTAARFVFYLIKMPQKEFDEFISSLTDLKKSIKICGFCFNPFNASASSAQVASADAEENLCPICNNPGRDKTMLCVVEKETDLIAIEKTKRYKGLYFILGGTVSTLRNENIKKLRIEKLKERVKEPKKFIANAEFKEVIVATNPTTEGEATALLIERELKPLGTRITRLGRGLPTGGELEYADEDTLGSAFEGRK